MSQQPTEIVGVDLSLSATGIARLTPTNAADALDLVTKGTVVFTPSQCYAADVTVHGRDGLLGIPSVANRAQALDNLAAELFEIIIYGDMLPPLHDVAEQPRPVRLVLIETPTVSRSGGGQFERGAVWYNVVDTLRAIGIPVVGVDPSTVKLFATGRGNAGKGEVIDAVARRFPAFETKGNDNAADAAVLAALGAHLLGQPIATLPATHVKALGKIAKPADLDAPAWPAPELAARKVRKATRGKVAA